MLISSLFIFLQIILKNIRNFRKESQQLIKIMADISKSSFLGPFLRNPPTQNQLSAQQAKSAHKSQEIGLEKHLTYLFQNCPRNNTSPRGWKRRPSGSALPRCIPKLGWAPCLRWIRKERVRAPIGTRTNLLVVPQVFPRTSKSKQIQPQRILEPHVVTIVKTETGKSSPLFH